MVGTLFLFMYWPSFNAVLVVGSQRERVMVNTILAITGSCIAACAVNRIF